MCSREDDPSQHDAVACEDDGDGFCHVHAHWIGDEPEEDEE